MEIVYIEKSQRVAIRHRHDTFWCSWWQIWRSCNLEYVLCTTKSVFFEFISVGYFGHPSNYETQEFTAISCELKIQTCCMISNGSTPTSKIRYFCFLSLLCGFQRLFLLGYSRLVPVPGSLFQAMSIHVLPRQSQMVRSDVIFYTECNWHTHLVLARVMLPVIDEAIIAK